MTSSDLPSDPASPVITSPEELGDALAQYFLANAATGRNAANDELVAQLAAWKRGQRDVGR